jgi:uncharacterized membrane protein YciS (DUF1049 family)
MDVPTERKTLITALLSTLGIAACWLLLNSHFMKLKISTSVLSATATLHKLLKNPEDNSKF